MALSNASILQKTNRGDRARTEGVEAGDAAEERRLAAAARTEQRDDLARTHVEVDVGEHVRVVAVAGAQSLDVQRAHPEPPSEPTRTPALGTAAALAAASGGRAGRLMDGALMLPLGTSAVTLGLGLLLAFRSGPLAGRGAVVLVPIAQALVAIPFVVRTLLPVLRAIDERLREAAATLGATPRRVWREVDLPIISRAGLVAAGFSFAVTVGEFGATIFVARAANPTIPVAIHRALGLPGAVNLGRAMALSVLLALITGAVVLVIDRVRVGSVGRF